MEIISKSEAIESGAERYYTGKPCRRGHLSERYTNSGHCIMCHKEKGSQWADRNKKRVKELNAKWYMNNKDKVLERTRKWQKENRERVYKNLKAWARANREKRSAYARARHARIAGSEGHHSAEDVFDIMKSQRGMCAICDQKLGGSRGIDYHVDHIYPISKGGSNWPENLQILCIPCNLKKHAKDPIEYAQSLGRLL